MTTATATLAGSWPETRSETEEPAKIRELARSARHGPLAALLTATALLYLVGLSKSGWANEFYSAAAEASSKSWQAWLFGSLDWSNFITVDKPPAALWVTGLSVRLFGLNSWAILVPQALEGVAAVALLYAAVKRVSTPTAGLLAGAVLATTPVATLMFRYNNPDALLVLLMTAAGYATVRAIEHAKARWLILAGTLIGFAFLTKMLQGLLVLPGFAAAYLVVAPTSLGTRIRHVLAGGAAMIVAAGWWIALVELLPASSRPYIGGSNTNSILELTFGYNGFGRLDGASNNGNVNGGTGGFSSAETGWTRLFGSEMGSQISWLLPAALIAIGALAWLTWKRPRTDRLRGSLIMWGGWLLVTGIVLSFASGIIHPYYTVALAPAIGALVGIGVVELWRERANEVARCLLACVIAAGSWWTFDLIGRTDWNSWLRWVILLSGAGAVAITLMPVGTLRRAVVVLAPLTALTLLAGPTAYAVQTASTGHTGAIPSAGPASTGFGGGGGFGAGRAAAGPGAQRGQGGTGGGPGGPPTGGFGGGGGAAGGLGGASTVSTALAQAFASNASNYMWVAATTSDNEAASLELGTGEPVMSLGGYNGTDPAISLAAFKLLVSNGKIHYYVSDSSGFIGSTSAQGSTAYQIQQWVESTYASESLGGTTVYDLTTTK